MLLGLLLAERTPGVVFEIGSSFAIDLVDKATTFFTCFKQVERSDLDSAKFWGIGPHFVDFHGYRVLKDCLDHLEAVYCSHGDFRKRFPFSYSAREHFLKQLGCVMNDMSTILWTPFLPREFYSGGSQFKS